MKKRITLIAFTLMAFMANAQSNLIGDVNGDRDVNVTDVTLIVAHIMGQQNDNFIAANADVNSDGNITVTDVTKLVSIILEGNGGAFCLNTLVLWHKDGTTTDVQLNLKPKVEFTDDKIIITSNVLNMEYPKSDILRFTYKESGTDITAAPPTTNQTISDAIFIYRNDDDFNAFFREEVDSIRYDEVMTQVIYTPDSIYRMSLPVIDSISFVQPEVILSNKVIQMDKTGLMDYLIDVDGMTLFFDSNTPKSLRPSKGDILICTDFDSWFFTETEGFIGKIKQIRNANGELIIDCVDVEDLSEIFEQLITIEKIVDDDEANMSNIMRVKRGEWISSRNPISMDLGFHADDYSLSGKLDGTYIATVTFNLTHKKQLISLRLDHDWQYGAHLKFEKEMGSFGYIGSVGALPAFRFPAALPLFKFQIAGAPFLKGEGNVEVDFSLSSPKYSYITEVGYRDGHFYGFNKRNKTLGEKEPIFDTVFSLNGKIQCGYMVDLYLGTINCLKSYFKTGLDFYIGPQITGDFNLKAGTADPVNFYSVFKDSKLGLSLLTIDYEAYGEASIFGHKTPKALFLEGSIQSPFYHEWYILPEFSELSIRKSYQEQTATVKSTPTRDILFPMKLGMGLYDKNEKLVQSFYEDYKYKRENKNFRINQTFSSLQCKKNYIARPMIMIFDKEFPANPTKDFKLEDKIEVNTLDATKITKNSAMFKGEISNYTDKDNGECGFFYNNTGIPSESNGTKISVGKLSNFSKGTFANELSGLEENTRYYYCSYYYANGEYNCGEQKSFKTKDYSTPAVYSTCPDDNHPHLIDLGLPSGTLWACCNVGADKPEAYGGYYAWGETKEKNMYTDVTYQYCTGVDFDEGDGWYDEYDQYQDLGYDIAGTEYDVAHVLWGGSWVMPSADQFIELFNSSSPWTEMNGVKGRFIFGSGFSKIFLPAAGFVEDLKDDDVNYYAKFYGCYWLSSQSTSDYNLDTGLAPSIVFDYTGSLNWWRGSFRWRGFPVRPVWVP